MSQTNVERVIGRLVTDEALRRRFEADPRGALGEFLVAGWELTPCELDALLGLDPELLREFAGRLDGRIQKADLCGGRP